ncbi:hypothetical protein NLI96_g13195 [Meripilus lineatus]|uniref:Uncharacterized protein n=1 Tax=Meripilus lineatus TaxID=2056292 RepID=A0AAD5USE1_9APHY|nr:hypothetical protein NLI96_g13195 [Physisporinus lineatus]
MPITSPSPTSSDAVSMIVTQDNRRSGAQELLDELHTTDASEALNEVERIYQLYSTIQRNGFSIRSLSLRIRSQASLAPSDIIDFGPRPQSGMKRYQIRPELYAQIEATVQSLQGLIDDLISLIPDRESGRRGFRIDPTNDVLEVLQGADRLISLYGAYEVIRKRMDRAAQFLEKYYRLCKGEAITSPATTSAEIHERFDPGASTDRRILEHIGMTNSFGRRYSIDQRKELDAFMNRELDEVVLLTKDVEQAFPNKPTSVYPLPYTYIEAPSKRNPTDTYNIVKFSSNDQHYSRVQYVPQPPINVSFADVSHSTDKPEAQVQRSVIPEGQSLEYEEVPSISSAIPGAFKFKSPTEFFGNAPSAPKSMAPPPTQVFSMTSTLTDTARGTRLLSPIPSEATTSPMYLLLDLSRHLRQQQLHTTGPHIH